MRTTQRRSRSEAATDDATGHVPGSASDWAAVRPDVGTKQMHVDLPSAMHKRLRMRSVEEGRPMSKIVESLIAGYLAG